MWRAIQRIEAEQQLRRFESTVLANPNIEAMDRERVLSDWERRANPPLHRLKAQIRQWLGAIGEGFGGGARHEQAS